MMHVGSIRYGSLFRYVMATLIVAAAGLNYLHVKHQYHLTGARKVALEKELGVLTTRSRDLDWQISALTSHTAVQAHLTAASSRFKDIPEGGVVNLRFFPVAGHRDGAFASSHLDNDPDDLQTVSHERWRMRDGR